MIRGYKVGADDYLNKPFDIEVLLLKLDVLFNRSAKPETSDDTKEYTIGNYHFEVSTRQLTGTDKEQKLSTQKRRPVVAPTLPAHDQKPMPREKSLKINLEKKIQLFHHPKYGCVHHYSFRKYLASDETGANREFTYPSGYGLRIRQRLGLQFLSKNGSA